MNGNVKKITQNLQAFLNSHSSLAEGQEITNTRIGLKDVCAGGKYHIPLDEYDQFLTIYHNDVILQPNTLEYLTEKQLVDDGPILIDLDFRYNYSIQTRQYTDEHVTNILNIYLDELEKLYQFFDEEFPIYVLQKASVKPIESKGITKDGIHFIIGLKSKRNFQVYLRQLVIERLKDEITNLPIINTWEEVVDESIALATTSWQLYGSRKPNCDIYQLTKRIDVVYTDGTRSLEEVAHTGQVSLATLSQLSARYPNWGEAFPRTDINVPNYLAAVHERKAFVNVNSVMDPKEVEVLLSILTIDDLKSRFDEFYNITAVKDPELKDLIDFTMALPAPYYTVFKKWLEVGWALKNTSNSLFIVWVWFSAQWTGFKFPSHIRDLYGRWQTFHLHNPNGFTKRSIIYWLKTDAHERFVEIRDKSGHQLLLESLRLPDCGDVDIARIMYHYYKGYHVCVSISKGLWYKFVNHKWKLDDGGTSLSQHISKEIRNLYMQLLTNKYRELAEREEKEEEKAEPRGRGRAPADPMIAKLTKIVTKLGNHGGKSNIMKEAMELFYDDKFYDQIDMNRELLGFENGVFDFSENVFRPGRPDDYITKSTQTDYNPRCPDLANFAEVKASLEEYMHKNFPIQEVYDFMWDYLASLLLGLNPDQTFAMFVGKGKNGKSALLKFIRKLLGDYTKEAPLTLITEKRGKIGGVSPEIADLKGLRFVTFPEPSVGDSMHEGTMKTLTGDDPLQGRALFMPPVTFVPTFKVCLATNNLIKMNAQDDGTWRRIWIVDFIAKFVDNPVEGDPLIPYQYRVMEQEEMNKFMEDTKDIFMYLLIEIAKHKRGKVNVCQSVMHASTKYKSDQDIVFLFIQEKVEKREGVHMTKSDLSRVYGEWYQATYGSKDKSYNTKDVHNRFNALYGDYPWKGVAFKNEESREDLSKADETSVTTDSHEFD
jgi:P4 family phage/plasmid primase-like protien